MTRDAIGDLLAPLALEAPELDPVGLADLATPLLDRKRLSRAASRPEAAILLFAATAIGHEPTTDLVRIGLCEAALRDALHHDEAAIAKHMPEFRRLAPGCWDADAFSLLELAANAPPGMRLRHLRIDQGRVPLTMDLLNFHAIAHLALRLPKPEGVPDWVKTRYAGVMGIMARCRLAQEARQRLLGRLEDVPTDYPPCIRTWLSNLSAGVHLKHYSRYNLLAFLGRVGWNRDRLLALFADRPGYNAREMTYQISHIKGDSGEGYAPMGCDQLRSLNLCPDSTCPGPTPLSVYGKRRRAPGWGRQRTP